MAVDAAGDVFIADSENNRVREVNHTTGVITTIAGNGTMGYNGDNILATSARLNVPAFVAVDASGNLFIADWQNNRIREVNHATGVITTVAGNGIAGYNGDNIPAAGAEVNQPDELALDGTGNLFFLDTGNNRIREVPAGQPADHLVLIANATQTAGATGSFTIEALTPNNVIDTSFSGKVHFTSSDPHATLPADVTLTGPGVLSITLRTAGNQTLTASSPTAAGNVSATVQVTPAAVSQFLVSVPAATAGATVTATTTAEDAFGNVATGYTGTVVLTSSDTQATLPAAYTFQSGDKGSHSFAVVFHTAALRC